jgi:GH43 family beta-xylosidase
LRMIQREVAVACLLMAGAIAAVGKTPNNPVLNHPDPFITWAPVNGNYMLLATTARNITIWFGPTVPTVTARPRVVFTPGDGMMGLVSPTIWNMEGHWWIYFSAKYPGKPHEIYVLESDSDDPLGKYSLRGKLDLGHPSIDPSLLMLNGATYLMYVTVDGGKNAIHMVKLAHPMETIGTKALITEPDQPWEKGVIHNNYPVTEGPTALYHDGKTFIVYSGSNTMSANYCMGLLTYVGGDPLASSSWRKTGPVFKSAPDNGIFSPGRGSFAESADGKTFWLLYHAKTNRAITMAGREIREQPFTWNPDGSPNFGIPSPDGPVPGAKS